MKDIFEVSIMALKGVSASIFDFFFVFTLLAGYLTLIKFNQSNNYLKQVFKKPKEMMVELIVQGIAIGVIFSLIVTLVGFPIEYSQYLFFLLPMSFVLGYYHVRYTNIVYSGLLLSVLSMVLNGQEVFGLHLPSVAFNMSGMTGIIGLLLLIEGLLIYMLRRSVMMPILAKKDGQIILGYAVQRFWPIPVVLLVATEAITSGDAVPMPLWWPFIGSGKLDQIGYMMILLPLLFVMSHGTMSFTKKPIKQLKEQGAILMASGVLLLVTSFILDRVLPIDSVGVLAIFFVAYIPEWYHRWQEANQKAIFEKTQHGVRVMHVNRGGKGADIGFEVGDLITSINGTKVLDLTHYLILLKTECADYHFDIERHGHSSQKITYEKNILGPVVLDMIYVPDVPEKVYDYDYIKNMGMLHMLRLRRFK